MQFKDYYETLGVPREATQDEIKKAFRPPPDWDAGYEFSGHGFAPHEAADFSDFFSELFGRMGGVGRGDGRGGFHARGAQFRTQGEDHHAKVLLDLGKQA